MSMIDYQFTFQVAWIIAGLLWFSAVLMVAAEAFVAQIPEPVGRVGLFTAILASSFTTCARAKQMTSRIMIAQQHQSARRDGDSRPPLTRV